MILQDVLQWNHTEMGWFFRCKTTMTSTHFATQEPAMVGWSFKNTRCFDQGRYMYRFAPEVSDCFMSWSNFRAHLLNSKWGRSIVFDIGRLLKKNNTLIPHTATSRRLYLRVLPSFRHLCVGTYVCYAHYIHCGFCDSCSSFMLRFVPCFPVWLGWGQLWSADRWHFLAPPSLGWNVHPDWAIQVTLW